jgi:uncharacterized OB-fold protein
VNGVLYTRCRSCGRAQPATRVACAHCRSSRLETATSSGRGTIHSFTTTHVLVDVDEGFRIIAQLRLPPYASTAYIGQPVELDEEPSAAGPLLVARHPS